MKNGDNGDGVKGNTKLSRPEGKRWCFTLNNPKYDHETMITMFGDVNYYVFQKEKGEKGTEHYQGYIEFKKKIRLSALKKIINKAHWEQAKASRLKNIDYCTKNETKIAGPWASEKLKKPIKIIENLLPFQADIIKMIDEEPDDRTINCLIDTNGNIGKTALIKYLCVKRDDILFATGGQAKDIFNLFYNADMNGFDMTNNFAYFLNVPRDSKAISYKSIECIKDGLITNTKYEAGNLIFNSPHVWIMINEEPEYDKLSADRWKLWTVNEKKELIKYEINDDENDI